MAEGNEFSMDEFTKPADSSPKDEDWSDDFADASAEAEAMGSENLVARVGLPIQLGFPPLENDEPIVEALRQVHDPEIPINIYDLGLIYDILRSRDGDVKIRMTLTAPGCPVVGELPVEVAETVSQVRGVGVVEVYMVWDPPWSPDCMSEAARILLDCF